MAQNIFPIVNIGHEGLRTKAQKINKSVIGTKLKALGGVLVQTMRKNQGVGLAANQVGLGIQFIVMECRKNKRYPKAPSFPLQLYINPRILQKSKRKVMDWEGCLSIPGYRGYVPRSDWVLFQGMDLTGQTIKKKLTGFEARVLQHEIDHLNGQFYIDRMPNLKNWIHLDYFN